MNTLRRIAEPTTEPVTLAEVKLHLRIDGSDEDALLNVLIASARRWFEDITGRTLYATTYEYSLGEWPRGDRIVLPRATTLTSVASLVYYGTDGTPATWDASNYLADTVRTPGALVLAYGNSWPSADLYPVEPIRVRYTAGMATSSPLTTVPDGIKTAVLFAIGDWYERREAMVASGANALAPAHMVGLGPMVDQWRLSYEF
jgi:uncharacterized phiE125 gp8 family phage protein